MMMQRCAHCGKQFQSAGTACSNCGNTILISEAFPHTTLADQHEVTDAQPLQGQKMSTFTHIDYKTMTPIQSQPTQSPSYYPVSYAHPPVKPRVLPKGAIIAALLATFLLVLSGITLIYYATVLHPTQLRSQATHTAATVFVETTSTAQAQTHALGTARAQATAQLQATASTLQNIYSTSTQGTPTFSSSLATQSTMNWDIYTAQGGGGCAFTENALHASIAQKGFYIPCFAQTAQFADFALEVQANILQGDQGGIIFRGNDKNGTFYTFRITQDGNYSLDMHTSSNNSTNLTSAKSAAIQAHQPNILGIVARGSNLYLYINKQSVATVSDNSYSMGKIGLFAVDKENATDVAFSNIRIWNL